jgi:hypothetical protein
MLVVNPRHWMKVYHFLGGHLIVEDACSFFSRYKVTHLFEAPIKDKKKAAKSLMSLYSKGGREGFSVFLTKSGVGSMVGATEHSATATYEWVVTNGWKQIYVEHKQITSGDLEGLDKAS